MDDVIAGLDIKFTVSIEFYCQVLLSLSIYIHSFYFNKMIGGYYRWTLSVSVHEHESTYKSKPMNHQQWIEKR